MNYHKITKNDIANGEGVGVVLWVSGCRMNCQGCHNPQTWKFESGVPFTDKSMNELIQAINKSYISHFTLSGGHPLEPENIDKCTEICKQIKTQFPDKTIWLYTGNLFEEVKDLLIMQYADVVVDGKFIVEQKDISLPWRGSANQRVWRKDNDGKWTM